MALRQGLELGCGASVPPEQEAVRDAANAFDEEENLRDPRTAKTLNAPLRRLISAARYRTASTRAPYKNTGDCPASERRMS